MADPSQRTGVIRKLAATEALWQEALASGWAWAEPVWTTRDGRKVPYSQLTAEHLINCINMLYRRPTLPYNTLRCLFAEAARRGLQGVYWHTPQVTLEPIP